MIVWILLIQGCEQKTKIIKKSIPKTLFLAPSIEARNVQTQEQTALFMLDIFEAYEKCVINLQTIERLYND